MDDGSFNSHTRVRYKDEVNYVLTHLRTFQFPHTGKIQVKLAHHIFNAFKFQFPHTGKIQDISYSQTQNTGQFQFPHTGKIQGRDIVP